MTSPARAPIPNVRLAGRDCPGCAFPCTNCFSVVYVVNRTAEFAPWRIICTEKIQDGVSKQWAPKGLREVKGRTTGKSPR